MEKQSVQYPSDEEAKALIIDIGKRIYDRGFVAANDGNISCRVSKNEIWVTATNVSKGFMTEKNLVKINLDGEILEGDEKPSSETKMHLRVYRESEDLNGVVHTHPMHATAFACAGLPLDSRFLPEGIVQLGKVPCIPFAMPGTEDVPNSIAPYITQYNAVLLGNHGALTWGDSLIQAWMRMETVEYLAHITILNKYILKKYNDFTDEEIDLLLGGRSSFGIRGGSRPS